MNRQEFEEFRASAGKIVKDICSRYGLYGNVMYFKPSPIEGSNRNRLYILAGTNPAFSYDSAALRQTPEETLREIERNQDFFYPTRYAFDLSENPDEMHATHKLVEYCKKAALINQLYAEYGLVPPDRLRMSEVTQLINIQDKLDNPRANASLKRKCRQDLDWFFKRERSKGFRRRWLEYFRSSKFPKDKGVFAKLRGYFNREDNRISLELLTDGSGDLRKIEMQEFEFKLFEKFIRECYPDVLYAVGDKEVVDHGIIGKSLDEENPFGHAVTAEEYAVIRKERFASEGWEALANMTQAYWEFRDVYYKAADEPLVASAYNSIILQYAKCDTLSELKSRGSLCLQKIPAADFMNFVSLAKENKLRFYIDNLGEYDVPTLETINVIFNEHQQGKMSGIVNRMIEDKVNFSHVMDTPLNPPLNSMIEQYTEKNIFDGRASTKKKQPPTIE